MDFCSGLYSKMGVQHPLQLMLVITELLNIQLSLNVQALMYPLLVACKSISRERQLLSKWWIKCASTASTVGFLLIR